MIDSEIVPSADACKEANGFYALATAARGRPALLVQILRDFPRLMRLHKSGLGVEAKLSPAMRDHAYHTPKTCPLVGFSF